MTHWLPWLFKHVLTRCHLQNSCRLHGITVHPIIGGLMHQCAGVVVYSMTDVPLGFGTTAKSTMDARKMDPGGIVVFHQVP